jgi:hypothetical protein
MNALVSTVFMLKLTRLKRSVKQSMLVYKYKYTSIKFLVVKTSMVKLGICTNSSSLIRLLMEYHVLSSIAIVPVVLVESMLLPGR